VLVATRPADHSCCRADAPEKALHARIRLLIGLLVLVTAASAAAQEPANRIYLPNTADEDWTFLKDPAKRIDVWDPLKYVSFGAEDYYMTLSGEFRMRPEGLRIRGVGERPTTTDNYLLQRYLFGADVHLGAHVRVFAELQSGIINGKLGSPRPTDRDSVDLHQAFVELRHRVDNRPRLLVKLGRQELTIGSTRLISASPGLNVKRSFDGATVFYRAASWNLVGSVAQLVGLSTGSFDDRSSREQLFWGVGAARRSFWFERGEFGMYYLGIDRRHSLYAQGTGPETRNTVGWKWSGTGTRLDLNYDGVFQWGHFNGSPLRAWAFATESGFRMSARRWRPRIGVRVDLASGDTDAADPRLQSFNPLFPGNAYSGAVGFLGPTNLSDLTPALNLFPRRNLTVSIESPTYWRTSTADGVYRTDLRLLIPPGAGTGKYVGTNPGIVGVYQATRHLQVQGAITRFLSGGFLERTFVAKGFGFYSLTALYRF
jgi:Alginate export